MPDNARRDAHDGGGCQRDLAVLVRCETSESIAEENTRVKTARSSSCEGQVEIELNERGARIRVSFSSRTSGLGSLDNAGR